MTTYADTPTDATPAEAPDAAQILGADAMRRVAALSAARQALASPGGAFAGTKLPEGTSVFDLQAVAEFVIGSDTTDLYDRIEELEGRVTDLSQLRDEAVEEAEQFAKRWRAAADEVRDREFRMREQARRIDDLRTEVRKLTADRDLWHRSTGRADVRVIEAEKRAQDAADEVRRLREENARLRTLREEAERRSGNANRRAADYAGQVDRLRGIVAKFERSAASEATTSEDVDSLRARIEAAAERAERAESINRTYRQALRASLTDDK